MGEADGEEGVATLLHSKLAHNKIFVNCGPVLIVTNPYAPTDSFSGKIAANYHGERECDPSLIMSAKSHLFSLCRALQQKMVVHSTPQSALFLGYSGSGKSYAADMLLCQAIRPIPIARLSATPIDDPWPLYDCILKSVALLRRAISAGSVINSASTRAILEVQLKFNLPTTGDCRVGRVVGAKFDVYGLERWRCALRRPVGGKDTPFFLLNEVIAALTCTGFSKASSRVIDNAWKADEREFLSALVRSCLNGEVSSKVREWGVSFEATVLTLMEVGMAPVQIAQLFRSLSATLLLSNIDFNAPSGVLPIYLSINGMCNGSHWKGNSPYPLWPANFGNDVKCDLSGDALDISGVIEAELNRRQTAKQLAKKAGKTKAESSVGLPLLVEKGIISTALSTMLPTMAHVGMSEDMMDVAAVQGGLKKRSSYTQLREKLLERLTALGDRVWLSPTGGQVNPTIIDIVAELLEVQSTELFATLTQPTLKEKTVNIGTTQSRCDSVASAVYSGVVKSIVDSLNLHFEKSGTAKTNSMIVVDTLGIEEPETAHFSQLHRNLYAEMFNSFYVTKTFAKYEKLRREENFDGPVSDYSKISTQVLDSVFGNSHVKVESVKATLEAVSLSSAPGCRFDYSGALLQSLETLSQFPCVSLEEDERAWDLWNALTKGKEKLLKKDKKLYRDAELSCKRFCMQHYSGKIRYSVETWVEGNRSVMTPALCELLETSTSSLVRTAAEGASARSILSEFEENERLILSRLHVSQPHYVQCVRPNNTQKPLSFDWQTVRAQVRAMQIGPLSVIFASGYHIFYAIIEFVSKFRDLLKRVVPSSVPDAEVCTLILTSAGITDGAQVGRGVLMTHKADNQLIESLVNARQKALGPRPVVNRHGPTIMPRSPGGAPLPGVTPGTLVEPEQDMYLDLGDLNPRQGTGSPGFHNPDGVSAKRRSYTVCAPSDRPVGSQSSFGLHVEDDDDDMYLDLSEAQKSKNEQDELERSLRGASSSSTARPDNDGCNDAEDDDDDEMYLGLCDGPVNKVREQAAAAAAVSEATQDDDVYLELDEVSHQRKPDVIHSLAASRERSMSHSGAARRNTEGAASPLASLANSIHSRSMTSAPKSPAAPRFPAKVAPAETRFNRNRSLDDVTMSAPRYGSNSSTILAPNTPKSRVLNDLWFHGLMERNEAVQRLEAYGGECFLVRESTTREGSYTLSFVHKGQINHFKISIMGSGMVRIPGNHECFNDLCHLVDYHQKVPISKDGKLLHIPCPKTFFSS